MGTDTLRLTRNALITAGLAAALLVALIWGIHRNSPRTLVSFHGFLHATVTQQFIDGAALGPPENPFYAGRSLPYYWFFHWTASLPARALGLNPFVALELVVLAAAVLLVSAAVALGVVLYRSVASGLLMAWLVLAGTNPLGFVFAGVKVLREPSRLQDDLDELWGVAHPLYSLIRFNDFGGLYGPLMNFFLNTTSRPVALAALMLSMLCLQRALHTRRAAWWLALPASMALTTAMSPVVGLAASGALLVALLITAIALRGSFSAALALLAGVALLAGALAAAPTYVHLLLGPSASKPQFWLLSAAGLKHAVTVALSVTPLLAAALWALRAATGESRAFLVATVLAAGMLLSADLAFNLPAANQSNCFHAAVVLLAVGGAGVIFRRGAEATTPVVAPWRLWLITAACLPTFLLLIASYISRPPLPADFGDPPLVRRDEDPRGRLYAWLLAETPRDAVLVVDPAEFPPMCGNAAEFPLMTRRAIFSENPRHYLVEPYADAPLRATLQRKLLAGAELTEPDRNYLLSLARPLYVIRQARGGLQPAVRAALGAPVFDDAGIYVFAVRTGGP